MSMTVNVMTEGEADPGKALWGKVSEPATARSSKPF